MSWSASCWRTGGLSPTDPTIRYIPRPGTSPEAELSALATCFRYILDHHAKKMATEPAPEPDGRDGTKVKGDSASGLILPD